MFILNHLTCEPLLLDQKMATLDEIGGADVYRRRFRSPVTTGGERRTSNAAKSRPIRSAGKLGDVNLPSSSWASSSSSAAGPLALPAAALVSGANGPENLGDEDGVGSNSGGSSGGSGAAWESSVKSDLIDCEAIYRVKLPNNCLFPLLTKWRFVTLAI